MFSQSSHAFQEMTELLLVGLLEELPLLYSIVQLAAVDEVEFPLKHPVIVGIVDFEGQIRRHTATRSMARRYDAEGPTTHNAG